MFARQNIIVAEYIQYVLDFLRLDYPFILLFHCSMDDRMRSQRACTNRLSYAEWYDELYDIILYFMIHHDKIHLTIHINIANGRENE